MQNAVALGVGEDAYTLNLNSTREALFYICLISINYQDPFVILVVSTN